MFKLTRCQHEDLLLRTFDFPIRFVAAPKSCSVGRIAYVVYVPVALSDFDLRELIRSTWARNFKADSTVKFIFVVGSHWLNESSMVRLDSEMRRERDILRSDTIEHYYNLTLKTYAVFKWIHRYCRHAKYVVRADSDTVLKKDNLDHFLKASGQTLKRTIVGHCHQFHCPTRYPSAKNCIPFSSFSTGLLPRYCFGFSNVISGDLVSQMLRHWQSLPYFHLEDIFLSGILAEALGDVQRVDRQDLFDYQTRFDSFACDMTQIASASYPSIEQQREHWTKYLNRCHRS
ncbi:unnamed protein product [Soboliphyme baturini]|uniref:Hexosyltransferase n=1 Tax=Soboliphyme baturini TaxID=241478 RepID=A0A183IMW4_9BILA|nr:unnamed protein product [Soboliphyme baturini]